MSLWCLDVIYCIIDRPGCWRHLLASFLLWTNSKQCRHPPHVSEECCHLPHPCLCLQVIIVDWDPKAVSLQPRNALILPKWSGADEDKTLVDLAAFVRTVASMGVDDVRTVLDHYSDSSNPLETFKQNQALLMEQQQQQVRAQVEDQKNKPLTGGFGFGLGRKRWSWGGSKVCEEFSTAVCRSKWGGIEETVKG